jgi:CRP-like cAMP-binding protein
MDDPKLTYIAYLESSYLFHGLERAVLEEIATHARLRRVQAGAYFFHQGDPAAVLYVLSAGRVKFTQVTPEGHSVLLRVIAPGEMFGTVAALGDAYHPASGEAAVSSAALAWNSATIRRLMERHPRLALNALRFLAGRLAEFQDRYRELATQRVERRVAHALLRLVRTVGRAVDGGVMIDLALSRQDIAEMSGTTLFTASRIMSGWESRGIIKTEHARILVIESEQVEAIAEDRPLVEGEKLD